MSFNFPLLFDSTKLLYYFSAVGPLVRLLVWWWAPCGWWPSWWWWCWGCSTSGGSSPHSGWH